MENKRTYAGIDPLFARYETSSVLLQPIPYDGTSTWGKGADLGFDAFMEASDNMELYDIETDSEVYKKGIHILDPILEHRSPEHLFGKVRSVTEQLLNSGKFLTFMGGEHSISIGIIEAFRSVYKDLTVLQLDAHTDLRASYLGTEYSHACAMHKASKTTNLLQVGIRSMDLEEKQYWDPEKCFLAETMAGQTGWIDRSIDLMTEDVYLSIDLDVFDPSLMPSTGTPEPGGLDWYTTLGYLRKVFEQKNIVGFDIVELAPVKGLPAPDFLVAKLYYKLLSYKYHVSKR